MEERKGAQNLGFSCNYCYKIFDRKDDWIEHKQAFHWLECINDFRKRRTIERTENSNTWNGDNFTSLMASGISYHGDHSDDDVQIVAVVPPKKNEDTSLIKTEHNTGDDGLVKAVASPVQSDVNPAAEKPETKMMVTQIKVEQQSCENHKTAKSNSAEMKKHQYQESQLCLGKSVAKSEGSNGSTEQQSVQAKDSICDRVLQIRGSSAEAAKNSSMERGQRFGNPDHRVENQSVSRTAGAGKQVIVEKIGNQSDLRRQLIMKYRSKHVRLHVCPYCLQCFTIIQHFRQHLTRMHLGQRFHRCSLCPKAFLSSYATEKHYKNAHGTDQLLDSATVGRQDSVSQPSAQIFAEAKRLDPNGTTRGKSPSATSVRWARDEAERSTSVVDDDNMDQRIEKSLQQTPSGYECFLCDKVYSLRSALIRHFCRKHSLLLSAEDPQILSVHSSDGARPPAPAVRRVVANACRSVQRRQPEKGVANEKENIGQGEMPVGRGGRRVVQCPWPRCFKFFTRSYIKVHFRVHTGEKSHKCSRCSKRFSRKTKLIEHKRTHRLKSQDQDSTWSPRANSSVGKRLRNHCTRSQKSRAGQLQAASSVKENLSEGARPSQQEKEKEECPECHKYYKISYIQKHIRIHTAEKPFKCSQCLEKFRWKYSLVRHIRFRHMTSEKEIDGAVSKNVMALENTDGNGTHLMYPKPSSPGRFLRTRPPYQCSYCRKRYSKMYRLVDHESVHEKVKLHKCGRCKRRFHDRDSVTRHAREQCSSADSPDSTGEYEDYYLAEPPQLERYDEAPNHSRDEFDGLSASTSKSVGASSNIEMPTPRRTRKQVLAKQKTHKHRTKMKMVMFEGFRGTTAPGEQVEQELPPVSKKMIYGHERLSSKPTKSSAGTSRDRTAEVVANTVITLYDCSLCDPSVTTVFSGDFDEMMNHFQENHTVGAQKAARLIK